MSRRPLRMLATGRGLFDGVDDRRYPPATVLLHQRKYVHAAMRPLAVEVEIVRHPDHGDAVLNPGRRVEASFGERRTGATEIEAPGSQRHALDAVAQTGGADNRGVGHVPPGVQPARLKAEPTEEGAELLHAVGACRGIRIEAVLLVAQVPGQEVAQARIHVQLAAGPVGPEPVTEAAGPAQRGEDVLFALDDGGRSGRRPDALERRERTGRCRRPEQGPEP